MYKSYYTIKCYILFKIHEYNCERTSSSLNPRVVESLDEDIK